jgi:hypothetical protein
MPRASWLERGLAVVGAFMMSGCFTYVPVEAPAPGTTVRARLPVESPVQGGRSAPDVVDVEGDVVSFGDTLVLATESTQMVGNFQEFRTVDTLRVSTNRLASLDERVFSRGRTVGFTALVVAGVVGIALAVSSAAGGGDDGGNNGGGNPAAIVVGDLGGILARILGGG